MLGKIFTWEFLKGKRPQLILILYFLLLLTIRYDVNTLKIESKDPISHIIRDYPPGSLIDIMWDINDVWWFSFPIILAYAIYLYSYELDKGIIRTYLLTCIRRRTLFAAKLIAIFLSVFLPLISTLMIAYPIADPILFMNNPVEVYINLPGKFILYGLMLYIMVCISTLSAVLFKKPLYAFAIPLAIIYVLNMLGIYSSYIPPESFYRLTLIVEPGFEQYAIVSNVNKILPSIIISTIALAIAYVIFIRRDIV
jgi:ABC-type transport system involved in multi-copper enzyme maturation permease subunit